MSERLRLSNSQLYTVSTCGESYRRRYIEKERMPGTLRMVRGIAVHRVAQAMHRKQLEAKEHGASLGDINAYLPTGAEAGDMGAAAFEVHVENEGVTISKEDSDLAGSEAFAKGYAKDTVVAMATHYARKVAPRIDPVAVERKVETKPKDASYEIVGVIDLVEASHQLGSPDGAEIISDLKTSTRAPRKDAIETSVQLPIYTLLRASETGKLPEVTVLRHLVERATGSIEVVEQRAVPSRDALLATVARLDAAARAIKAGIFIPAEAGHWKCSLKWCEFAGDCRFFIGRK